MTVAIQRQPRFHKVALVLGLIALVAVLAVAMIRAVQPEKANGNPVSVQANIQAGPGNGFLAIQDGYQTPAAVLSRQAALEAELRVQDGYIPPAAMVDRAGASLSIQDGYLPPAGWAASAEDEIAPRIGRQ